LVATAWGCRPVHTGVVLAEIPRGVACDLLARLDRAVPGRVEGFYVVGSASMGAFQLGRSDVDFVAIVNGHLRPAELARLRAVHLGRWSSALVRDTVLRRRWPLVCNGIYLRTGDLACSSLETTPLAGHIAGRFRIGSRASSDVNPVTWHMVARHSIALRGPDRRQLRVHIDDGELRVWQLANLNGYWRRWAERTRIDGRPHQVAPARRLAAWGVLGASRLHYTIATGEIATKEAAAHHALEVFDLRWHPLINDAIRYWHSEPPAPQYRRSASHRRHDANEFVKCVIDAANSLTPTH
jgi:hypothetical protein